MRHIESIVGRVVFYLILGVAVLAIPIAAHGTVMSWKTAADGNWNTAANWNPANVPDSAGESAVVPSSLTGPFTITLDISPSVGSLDIQVDIGGRPVESVAAVYHETGCVFSRRYQRIQVSALATIWFSCSRTPDQSFSSFWRQHHVQAISLF